jgi:hypothetical protein
LEDAEDDHHDDNMNPIQFRRHHPFDPLFVGQTPDTVMIDILNNIKGNKDQKGNKENMLWNNVLIRFII